MWLNINIKQPDEAFIWLVIAQVDHVASELIKLLTICVIGFCS